MKWIFPFHDFSTTQVKQTSDFASQELEQMINESALHRIHSSSKFFIVVRGPNVFSSSDVKHLKAKTLLNVDLFLKFPVTLDLKKKKVKTTIW